MSEIVAQMMWDPHAAEAITLATLTGRQEFRAEKRSVEVLVRAIDLDARTLDAVASDESVDRQGDIIVAAGWQLDRFKANPVITWGHDYQQPPVARAVEIAVVGSRLAFRPQFPTAGQIGESEHAQFVETVWQMYRHGFLNAFSVGFLPLKWEQREQPDGKWLGWRILEAELLEIAAVTVPANANALAIRHLQKSLDALTRPPADPAMRRIDPGAVRVPLDFETLSGVLPGLMTQTITRAMAARSTPKEG